MPQPTPSFATQTIARRIAALLGLAAELAAHYRQAASLRTGVG
jgi:hypothetical protein